MRRNQFTQPPAVTEPAEAPEPVSAGNDEAAVSVSGA